MDSERTRFDRAFAQCLEDGVHPGPTALSQRMLGIQRNNSLNGRLTARRTELLKQHGFTKSGRRWVRG